MTLSVPATSANLGPGLDVLGVSMSFRNICEIMPASCVSVEIYGEGEGVKRFIIDNTFVKIFYKTLGELGGEPRPFRFVFHNKIPISRGLGSSSAVIVGAISAAYHIALKTLPKQEILNRALIFETHPDNITPATFGGLTISMLERGGYTGKVFFIKHSLPSYLRAVVVIPPRSISTRLSREILPKRYMNKDVIYNLSHASVLSAAIIKEQWDLLRLASRDRLHQERRMRQYPVLFSVQKCALEHGALLSTLSGSGSSFFNLCFSEDASHITEELCARFPSMRVLIMELDDEGVRIEE